jgi:hypothetical protein
MLTGSADSRATVMQSIMAGRSYSRNLIGGRERERKEE